ASHRHADTSGHSLSVPAPRCRIRGVTPQTRWTEVYARRGLVASPHAVASEAGRSAFARGGNALDAVIAAAATIAVVYPHMNGIGGDNVWLIYDAGRRRLRALNAIGRSAAAVDLADYGGRFGAAIPPRGGAAALTVPGAVSGWWEAHTYSREAMGSPVAWKALLEDAVADAPDADVRRTLWPLYHPDRLTGARFVQRDLAATLAQVAESGPEEFYRGGLGR